MPGHALPRQAQVVDQPRLAQPGRGQQYQIAIVRSGRFEVGGSTHGDVIGSEARLAKSVDGPHLDPRVVALTLRDPLDRDSGLIADLFDERNAAVKILLSMAIEACQRNKKYIGICGQGPSDHPDLAQWLLDQGIESMSLNPDTVIETRLLLGGVKV